MKNILTKQTWKPAVLTEGDEGDAGFRGLRGEAGDAGAT